MAIGSAHLDDHLKRHLGSSGYSVSGTTVTVGSVALPAADLAELLRVANQTRHEVTLVAGAVTLKPV